MGITAFRYRAVRHLGKELGVEDGRALLPDGARRVVPACRSHKFRGRCISEIAVGQSPGASALHVAIAAFVAEAAAAGAPAGWLLH